MRREDLFKEIRLQDLLPRDILKLAENMIGGPFQASLAQN